jgi:hypothetical protein
MPAHPAHAARAQRPGPARHWSRLSDAELLQLRFCDLKLSLAGTLPERNLRRLRRELARRGIGFAPHAWLAEEWFSPDGVPGIAIPFFLAHPRLERLERRMMRQVEGGNSNWMMRILRHEAGHAIDNAWRLRRRGRWREVFGPASLPYPDRYRARPGSRRYVHHLDDWYAQSHPTEDFAETFAVWLKPNSDWRRSYAHWPARHKLHYVDELMAQLRATRPAVRNRREVEPLATNRRTLAEHYVEKLARRGAARRGANDDLLHQVFTATPSGRARPPAAAFLRANRLQLVSALVRDTGATRYSAWQVVRMAISRAADQRLFLRGAKRQALQHSRWLLVCMLQNLDLGPSPQLHL